MSQTAEIINFSRSITMSGKHISGIPVELVSQLSNIEFKVYCLLSSFADSNNTCHPKQSTIAELLYEDWGQLNDEQRKNRLRNLRKVLQSLSEQGYISVQGDGRFGKPNDYTVNYRYTKTINPAKVVNLDPAVKKSPAVILDQGGKKCPAVKNDQAQEVILDQAPPVILDQSQASTPVQQTNTSTPEICEDQASPPDSKKFVLPNWVDKTTWAEFKKMRTRIKKQLTDYAAKLVVKDLEKFADQGFCPNKILERSIKNSWQGVFIPNNVQERQACMVQDFQVSKPYEYNPELEF